MTASNTQTSSTAASQRIRLTPAALWPAIVRQTEHALQCGALQPIHTMQSVIEDGGIRFVVRQVSSLTRKERQRERAHRLQTVGQPSANPFLPYEPDLFVADVSDTHVALLNKFNVIDHHLLIVTRAFEPQQTLLALADFEALMACMAGFDGIGFYNGGEIAGASQPHKHLQMAPLPLGEIEPPVPIEAVLPDAIDDDAVIRLPQLPFDHAFARIDTTGGVTQAAHAVLACYRALLDACDIRADEANGIHVQSTPYNLLVTRRWMLLVPRSTERIEGISINALAFAGSLFVKDAEQMAVIERLGPLALLAQAGRPRTTDG